VKLFSWTEAPHGFIVAADKRLEAAAYGPPPADAPTIVMLHEGLGCVALWRGFPRKLAEFTGWGVFSYSRAAYGASDPVDLPRPLDYMTHEALASLPEVMAAIGFRRGILLGHSDGASIAAIYAGARADARVRGLVLIAPHLFTETSGLASIAAAKRAYEAGELRAKLAKYHAHVDNAFYGWNGAWLDLGFKSWNIEAFVDGWRAPALLIQGEDDEYGTIAQVRAIERRAPTAVETLVLPGCRHAPHLERPEATLKAVAGLCARLKDG